jgi:hypothetical protein
MSDTPGSQGSQGCTSAHPVRIPQRGVPRKGYMPPKGCTPRARSARAHQVHKGAQGVHNHPIPPPKGPKGDGVHNHSLRPWGALDPRRARGSTPGAQDVHIVHKCALARTCAKGPAGATTPVGQEAPTPGPRGCYAHPRGASQTGCNPGIPRIPRIPVIPGILSGSS